MYEVKDKDKDGTPHEECKATEKVADRPHFIAVVQNYAGPGEDRPIAFIRTRTKREMTEALKDPKIATVVALLRGRQIPHRENRQVSF